MTPTHPRPAKGSTVWIDPLKSLEEVQAMKRAIAHRNKNRDRDMALFTLGVNTNLRASDLLNLTPGHVDWLESRLMLKERKTGKIRHIPLSPQTMALLYPLAGGEYLFPSDKSHAPLTMASWNRMIKEWAHKAGLRGNYGARTIRKTWARLQHTVFETPIVLISQELNHTNLRETYRYIGVSPEEVQQVYKNFI